MRFAGEIDFGGVRVQVQRELVGKRDIGRPELRARHDGWIFEQRQRVFPGPAGGDDHRRLTHDVVATLVIGVIVRVDDVADRQWRHPTDGGQEFVGLDRIQPRVHHQDALAADQESRIRAAVII